MGEEFHQNRVQTNCCLICGPTIRPLRSIINSTKLSTALVNFIDLDLKDPNLPPNCCENCRKKYIVYYDKHHRKFVKGSSECIAKHRSELQKRNLYPIFPYTPHTEDNCQVCEASLSIEDTANKQKNSGPVHNIPPSYSHPTRNRNEPKRLGDWNMGEEKINKKMKSNEENGHVQEMETNVMQIETQNMTEMSTSKVFLSQRNPPVTSILQESMPTIIAAKKIKTLIPLTKTYSKKTSTPANLPLLNALKIAPNASTISLKLFNSVPKGTVKLSDPSTNLTKISKLTKISASEFKKICSKTPNIVKIRNPAITIPVKLLNSGPTELIDLPTNPSNTSLTSIKLPFQQLDSPRNPCVNLSSSPQAINDFNQHDIPSPEPEPPDDRIDPLKQTADEESPHEPVGELLKIVKNLPLSDQVIFIKLLVLQLNDDMLTLMKKLVNTLHQEKDILKFESRRKVARKTEQIEEIIGEAYLDEIDKIDVEEFVLEPTQDKLEHIENFDTVEDNPLNVGLDQALVMSNAMKKEMIDLVRSDPIPPIDQKINTVVLKYKEKYEKIDPQLWKDIMVSFGENADVDEMLNSFRTELVGPEPIPDRPPVADNMYACSKCDQIFDCRKKRKSHHLYVHNNVLESSVVCDQCPKMFTTKSGWKNHMELHEEEKSQEKNIQCDECPMRFHFETLFRQHKYHRHSEVDCEKCGKKCHSKSELKKHELFKHSDPTKPRPFPCDQCPSAFFTNYGFQKHKICHQTEKPFPCNKCEKTFANNYQLTEHQNSHGTERNYKCKDCSKTFKFSSTLFKHVKVSHSSDLPYECDICLKRFPLAVPFKNHKLLHLDESQWPFVCDKCGQRFRIKGEMVVHIKKNCSRRGPIRGLYPSRVKGEKVECKHIPGTKKIECNICGKPMYRKNLKDHLATHSSERPYSCEECKKSFASKSSLEKHIPTHTKPFHCDQCSKTFALKRNLKNHQQTHSGERPYSCDQCSKTFGLKRSLKIHVQRHSGERPYSCDQCLKRFARKISVKRHKDRYHPKIGKIIMEFNSNI